MTISLFYSLDDFLSLSLSFRLSLQLFVSSLSQALRSSYIYFSLVLKINAHFQFHFFIYIYTYTIGKDRFQIKNSEFLWDRVCVWVCVVCKRELNWARLPRTWFKSRSRVKREKKKKQNATKWCHWYCFPFLEIMNIQQKQISLIVANFVLRVWETRVSIVKWSGLAAAAFCFINSK